MKKNVFKMSVCWILVIVLLVSLTGCISGAPDPTDGTTPTGDSDGTEPSTEPATEPTESATQPAEEKPSEPKPTGDPTDPEPDEHDHEYSSKVVAPTCTKDGYTVYTCKCGDSYRDDEKAALGHDYTSKVVSPTTTAEGYTLYTCSTCGNSYKDNYTDKLPAETEPHVHSYSSQVVQPTCTEKGYTKHTCSCGDSYTDNEKAAKGHSYEDSVVEPTCTEGGYTKHTCSVCGSSYTDSETAAAGHSYTVTVVDPTTESEGYTLHTCSVCGDSYKDSYTDKVVETADPWTVANLILYYINEFRQAEGTASLTYLPGMTQVAQYRSRQLVYNFAHDERDKREAFAYYQYGEYVDMSEYGYESYWTAYTGEAISMCEIDNLVDEDWHAYEFAKAIHDSANHWAYVGSSEHLYAGVGVTYSEANEAWYVCVMVGPINYG